MKPLFCVDATNWANFLNPESRKTQHIKIKYKSMNMITQIIQNYSIQRAVTRKLLRHC